MRLIHWIHKIFCKHTWYQDSPIYYDEISIAKWFYCPKCDNLLHVRYSTQYSQYLPYRQKIYLGGNKMDNIMKIKQQEQRLAKIQARPDAFKTPGVMRKIERNTRNLKKSGD